MAAVAVIGEIQSGRKRASRRGSGNPRMQVAPADTNGIDQLGAIRLESTPPGHAFAFRRFISVGDTPLNNFFFRLWRSMRKTAMQFKRTSRAALSASSQTINLTFHMSVFSS